MWFFTTYDNCCTVATRAVRHQHRPDSCNYQHRTPVHQPAPRRFSLGHSRSTCQPKILEKANQQRQQRQESHPGPSTSTLCDKQATPGQTRRKQPPTTPFYRLHGGRDLRQRLTGVKLHLTTHGQASMSRLSGLACPSLATRSRPLNISWTKQHRCWQPHRPLWPILKSSLWPQRQSQVHMEALAVLLLLATTHLMSCRGISTTISAAIPPLPSPWQRQQDEEEEEDEDKQHRWMASVWHPSHGNSHGKPVRTRSKAV
ncbi:hypothetical protein ACLKA6_004618 [Drosophila palustris]